MRRVAVLTSGGDAPGMNAAIRSVVRASIGKGWDVFGVFHGYAGLMGGEIKQLGTRDVGGIIQTGGTMLGSARAPEFKTEAGQKQALRELNLRDIDGLFVIGGNGSQSGANALAKLDFPVVGVASTIDNDLFGADITIGVDTALNIALEAVDRLKVTASSHQRAFLVEVMGRDCGYLALMAGIAGGAELVCIPEIETTPRQVASELEKAYARGKSHALIVVAEGAKYNSEALEKWFKDNKEEVGFELRATKLGHVQRGGHPGAFDRILATRTAAKAVDCMAAREHGVLVGHIKGENRTTPLSEVAGRHKPLDESLVELAAVLAQ